MLNLKPAESRPRGSLERDFSESLRFGDGLQYGRAYINLSWTTPRPSLRLSRGLRASEVSVDA